MPSIIERVISGGQTGADYGGLVAAKWDNIPTGGFAPRGFITTNGPDPMLASIFGLEEHSGGYAARTKANIVMADMTIVVASNINSPGTALTIREAKKLQKPLVVATYSPFIEDMEDWTCESSLKLAIDKINSLWYTNGKSVVINIAGNSDATCPMAFKFTFYFCNRLFEIINGPNL